MKEEILTGFYRSHKKNIRENLKELSKVFLERRRFSKCFPNKQTFKSGSFKDRPSENFLWIEEHLTKFVEKWPL